MHLRLLDLDGSLQHQPSLQSCVPWSSIVHVPLGDLAPKLRLWAGQRAIDAARERLGALVGPSVTLLGSGDFHHLTALLLEHLDDATTLLHFDNHPDWVWAAPRWHCGGWINRAIDLPRIARVVTIGPCSDDLRRPELRGGNVAALERGSLALFPWRHPPSRVYRRIGDGHGYRYEGGHLIWENLAELSSHDLWNAVLAAVPTESIWISIDKDVLPPEDAATNWDQGSMPLAAVLEGIAVLGRARRIVGADICGDWSPPRHRNVLKRLEARRDQPSREPERVALERNERTNVALLEALSRVAA